jgi:predicted metal-dependent phosphoesterase TrpH
MHSTYSDGASSPEEMVRWAKQVGLQTIALTDHDEVGGVDAAIEEGRACGLEVIPGIELSVTVKGRDIHVLGYFFDHRDAGLLDYVSLFTKQRHERVREMVRRLKPLGAPLEVEAVLAKSTHGAIGRPHVAEALVDAGHVSCREEAFDKFLHDEGPAYVPKYPFSPTEGAELIHRLGGVVILAHPVFYGEDGAIASLMDAGLDGLEADHPKQNESQRSHFRQMAGERGLLVTGGSDCHGERLGYDSLGSVRVPYTVVDALRERARRYSVHT